jgi:hypothetical protein
VGVAPIPAPTIFLNQIPSCFFAILLTIVYFLQLTLGKILRAFRIIALSFSSSSMNSNPAAEIVVSPYGKGNRRAQLRFQ